MKFKGDILITDPCYVIKDNESKIPTVNPLDYFTEDECKCNDKASKEKKKAYALALEEY